MIVRILRNFRVQRIINGYLPDMLCLLLCCRELKESYYPLWNRRSSARSYIERIPLLEWARANGCFFDKLLCASVAEGGHLDVLEWARANGCSWDSLTCAYAASKGHLDVLEWARANGCEWNSWTCRYAAQGRHLDVLEWARANGCPYVI